MHDIELLVPPPVDPVSVAEAFVELRLGLPGERISKHPDYAAVAAKVRAATAHCEDLTGRSFVRQTWRLTTGPSPRDWLRCRMPDVYELPRPPVRSIVAVSYIDPDGDEQIIDEASYYVIGGGAPQLRWVGSYNLPAVYDRPDALRIDYVAGYPPGTPADDYGPEDPPQHLAANVPAPLRQAVLLTLRLMHWEMAEGDRAATTNARDALLWPYKVLRV